MKKWVADFFSFKAFKKEYFEFFSVNEISQSRILQWAIGAILFALFINFEHWSFRMSFTKEWVEMGQHICWPYFQSCGDLAFLSVSPFGHTQTAFYMILFAVLLYIAYAMTQKQWGRVHFLLLCLFAWKIFMTFVSRHFVGNYDYFLTAFGVVVLFLPYKLFFLRFTLLLFYFLTTATKTHETWLVGTYFTALEHGLFPFPNSTVPIWTVLVYFMEMVGVWFLMGAKNSWMRKGVLLFFIAFHIYSGFFVGYRYPATVLPMLLILFGPWYENFKIPTGLKTIPGWTFVFLLFGLQFVSHLIPGDEKLTLEGNYYGNYMFEANHQCFSHETVYRSGEAPKTEVRESHNARYRCDPYAHWFRLKQQCLKNPQIKRIEWQFDHAINIKPYFRIVDVPNACDLEYKPFTHNTWIKTPKEGATIQGYPLKNYYR